MVVLNSEPLQFKILKFIYNSSVAGHPSHIKTYKIVQRVYYWPIMHDYIQKYIQACRIYIHRKTSHVKKQRVLQPLTVPIQKQRDISIDFVVDLPNSNKFTNIMVVVNRLTKIQHIIPIKSINTILVAKCFIKHIFKLHRLPNSIISDYRSQFISDFQ